MKKPILIIAALLSGCCAMLTVSILAFVMSLPSDIPSFDDSRLMSPTISLPDEQNAFTYYTKAAERMVRPENRDAFDDTLRGDAWDEEFVDDLLERNAGTFEQIEEGNRCDRCIPPAMMSLDQDAPYLSQWRALADLQVLRIQRDIHQRQPDRAMAHLGTLVTFAARLQSDPGSLIGQLVAGMSVRGRAMGITRDLVWSGILTARDLDDLQQLLAAHPPSVDGYVRSLQCEYRMVAAFIDDIHSGRRLIDDDIDSGLPPWLQRGAAKLLMQPNRTKRDFGTVIGTLIDQAEHCFADTDLEEWKQLEAEFREIRRKPGKRITNILGTVLCAMLSPAYVIPVEKKCQMQLYHRATLMTVACHRYKAEHGILPPTLDALTPDYLPAIPLDPFDGKPLRYSKPAGIIYSVGDDGVDSGGSQTLPAHKTHLNPWEYRWEAEDIVFGVEEEIPPERADEDTPAQDGQTWQPVKENTATPAPE